MMLTFIEKFFLKIAQYLGILFAVLAFSAVVVLGYVAYNKITLKTDTGINITSIDLADYQSSQLIQEQKISQDLDKNDRFNQVFNRHVDDIATSLDNLPDSVVDKADLKQKVRVLVKIKSNDYSQDLKLAYAQSLSGLLQQLVEKNTSDVNIDEVIQWHDQTFAQQVNNKQQSALQKNLFVQLSTLEAQDAIRFMFILAAAVALCFFILFVMMLAMLRIERNTRKG